MKKRNNYMLAFATAVFIIVIVYMFLVPQGSYVYALVDVQEETIQIEQCALKKGHVMSVIRADDNISYGTRNAVLRVIYNGTELLSTTRENIGVGSCALESNVIPYDMPIDSELMIQVELLDEESQLIATVYDSLVYK